MLVGRRSVGRWVRDDDGRRTEFCKNGWRRAAREINGHGRGAEITAKLPSKQVVGWKKNEAGPPPIQEAAEPYSTLLSRLDYVKQVCNTHFLLHILFCSFRQLKSGSMRSVNLLRSRL